MQVVISTFYYDLDFFFNPYHYNCLLAGINSLTTAYILDIVGIEKFGKAIGIVNLFRGLGCSGLILAGTCLFFF